MPQHYMWPQAKTRQRHVCKQWHHKPVAQAVSAGIKSANYLGLETTCTVVLYLPGAEVHLLKSYLQYLPGAGLSPPWKLHLLLLARNIDVIYLDATCSTCQEQDHRLYDSYMYRSICQERGCTYPKDTCSICHEQ
jgi:hypothetical protein